jgi:hypothetical protein
MGNNGGLTLHMRTAGDYLAETFTTGQAWVNGGATQWGIVDNFGGNPGAQYHNEIYINSVDVGGIKVNDCGYCGEILQMLAEGRLPKEIASILDISVRTVRFLLKCPPTVEVLLPPCRPFRSLCRE